MFDKMYMVKVFTKEHITYMYHNMFTISNAVHGYSLKYKLAGNYKLYSTVLIKFLSTLVESKKDIF